MSKALAAYFSATGTTRRATALLAKAAGADLYEIRPETPYTARDLNWHDSASRTSLEAKDDAARPALADTKADIAGHDVIFLGFPIWWYTAPKIIRTFLESYDFSGKTVVLFATSGGSGLGGTRQELAPCCPGAVLKDGKVFRGESEASLRKWAAQF